MATGLCAETTTTGEGLLRWYPAGPDTLTLGQVRRASLRAAVEQFNGNANGAWDPNRSHAHRKPIRGRLNRG